MALAAVDAELGLVRIVFAVAIDAGDLERLVLPRRMTLLAFDLLVEADQLEPREPIVIEADLFELDLGRVALLALGAELPLVRVAVAIDASELAAPVRPTLVTLLAVDSLVETGEREASVGLVIE